jgi:hypothetical protein
MTSAPRIARALTVYRAWSNDGDMDALYTDLDTAKTHAAYVYVRDEYGDVTDGPRATPNLTWVEEHGSWHLLNHGEHTLAQISEVGVYRAEDAAAVSAAARP